MYQPSFGPIPSPPHAKSFPLTVTRLCLCSSPSISFFVYTRTPLSDQRHRHTVAVTSSPRACTFRQLRSYLPIIIRVSFLWRRSLLFPSFSSFVSILLFAVVVLVFSAVRLIPPARITRYIYCYKTTMYCTRPSI